MKDNNFLDYTAEKNQEKISLLPKDKKDKDIYADYQDSTLGIENFDNINVTYEWKKNLLLDFKENYDITFIDTWHVYGQLKRELNKFSKITNKYIIMHDTTVDGIKGETIRNGWDANKQSAQTGIPVHEIRKGLIYAIKEFLRYNPEWYIKEVFTNNNGLTILARK